MFGVVSSMCLFGLPCSMSQKQSSREFYWTEGVASQVISLLFCTSPKIWIVLLKNTFCQKMPQFSCSFFLFQLFGMKNIEKADLDQCLEHTAPKPWSKIYNVSL